MLKQQQHSGLKQQSLINAVMHQGIQILQMSSQDLESFIEEQSHSNPFLLADYKYDNTFDAIEVKGSSRTYQNYDDPNSYIESIAESKSLKQAIIEQIIDEIHDPIERKIAFLLTEDLDENGYIRLDSITYDTLNTMKVSNDLLELVISKMQSFDPVGICARNLSECIWLQLQQKTKCTDQIKSIVDNLQLIAKNDIAGLMRISGLPQQEIISLIKQIKKLNPKPGLKFSNEISVYKLPDLLLDIGPNADICIRLNQDCIPEIRIDHHYYNHSLKLVVNQDDVSFINTKFKQAKEVVGNVKKRYQTLIAVAGVIAHHQADFFTKGLMHFKPLKLKDISNILNMSESTISRAVANKYIHTPFGVYELKFFFSSSVQPSAEDKISSTKIKEIIKHLVAYEQESGVYHSDDDITIELIKFNIKVARRTVTKYREMLKIPSMSVRKRVASYAR